MSERIQRLERVLGRAPFIQDLGLALVDAGEGWVTTELAVADRMRQQHGQVHAGVTATIADHTAGAAATTVVPVGHSVVTSEFKINLLRPGGGSVLRCRGTVVRPGRRLVVVEADVEDESAPIARYLGTMAVVPGDV